MQYTVKKNVTDYLFVFFFWASALPKEINSYRDYQWPKEEKRKKGKGKKKKKEKSKKIIEMKPYSLWPGS